LVGALHAERPFIAEVARENRPGKAHPDLASRRPLMTAVPSPMLGAIGQVPLVGTLRTVYVRPTRFRSVFHTCGPRCGWSDW
jgi:hypothetical protein